MCTTALDDLMWHATESPKKAEPETSNSWFGKKPTAVPPAKLTSVIDGLKEVYFNKVWRHMKLCSLHVAHLTTVNDCPNRLSNQIGVRAIKPARLHLAESNPSPSTFHSPKRTSGAAVFIALIALTSQRCSKETRLLVSSARLPV